MAKPMTVEYWGEWLTVIDADPDLAGTALAVATAMLNDGTIGPDGLDGFDPEAVRDAVDDLVFYGFLEVEFAIDWTETTERSLRLRFPCGYTDRSGYTWPAQITPCDDR